MFPAKLKSLTFPSPQKFNLRFNETFNLKQYILICGEAIYWIKVNKVINYLLFFNFEFFSRAISWTQGKANVWAPIYLHLQGEYLTPLSTQHGAGEGLEGEAFLGGNQTFGTWLLFLPQRHISILLCIPVIAGAGGTHWCCSSFCRQHPDQPKEGRWFHPWESDLETFLCPEGWCGD